MTSRLFTIPLYSQTHEGLAERAGANVVSCVQQARSRAHAALSGRDVRATVLQLVHADITETLMVKAALQLIEAPQYAVCRSAAAREVFLATYLTVCLLSWLAEQVAPEDRVTVAGTAESLFATR